MRRIGMYNVCISSDIAKEHNIACFSRKGEIKMTKPQFPTNVEKNRYVQISFMCVRRVVFNTCSFYLLCTYPEFRMTLNKLRVKHQIYS